MESFNSQTVESMMENGKIDRNIELEHSLHSLTTKQKGIRENGKRVAWLVAH